MKKPIKTFLDFDVYELAHKLSMEIFKITIEFPKEEKYSLTDQIRRSSRSVAVNITEGWGKRKYENSFKKHLIDSSGSLGETKSWLLISFDCKYIDIAAYKSLTEKYETLGSKLFKLHDNWKSF